MNGPTRDFVLSHACFLLIVILGSVIFIILCQQNYSNGFCTNLEGWVTPTRSHQFISTVGLDNRTVWFCPVTDHGNWLCGNYSLADNVSMLPSIHWHNETNVLIDAYWDGTYYTSNGKQWKTLVGIYGNRSTWLLDSWVYATLLNGVVVKLEEG